MAVKRSSSKSESRPEPLNTYGLPVFEGFTQLHYDRAAFAHRFGLDRHAPTRFELFKKIANKMFPGYFEWHEWTERIIHALVDDFEPDEKRFVRLAAFPGCSGCVAGHTRILNPISGEQPTIEDLFNKQIPPVVMTLNGPVLAGIPFLKGEEDLFEIELENGTKFSATAEHRVCVSTANANHPQFCHVSDLKISQHLPSYEPILPESNSESFPLTHSQGVLCSRKIAEDFQESCYHAVYPGGVPLPLEEDSDQSLSPSQVGAHKHNHRFLHLDVLVSKCKHILFYLLRDHPSIEGCENHHNSFCIPESHPLNQGIHAPGFQSFQQPFQFHSRNTFRKPFSIPFQNAFGSGLSSDASHLSDTVSSYGYRVSQSKVVSIRNIGKQKFYDLCVPDAHHYFAEGTIHHNSGKTFNTVTFATVWWLCEPAESSVNLVSTTRESLRQRGWAEVQRAYSTLGKNQVGNFVDSRMRWQWDKGDDKHAIYGRAVEAGSMQKVADDIKGIHTRRQLIIIDEATSVNEAILEACGNLYSYPDEFLLILNGNPLNRLDHFGRFCEPENGWLSVNVDTGKWTAKPFERCGGSKPIVTTFDAEKSPNIIEGKLISRHLPRKEEVESARRTSGGGNSPTYWQNKRGFWPPEGTSSTVFTESALIRSDAKGKHVFTGENFIIIGSVDPAFGGGDRPVLRFAKLGLINAIRRDAVEGLSAKLANKEQNWGIEAMPPIILTIDATSKNPVRYQLAEQIVKKCEKIMVGPHQYQCLPENVGIDDTGDGGLGDILHRTWSNRVVRIDFRGKPSDDAVSLEDVRKSSDVYKNKRAELYFYCRTVCDSVQLKGVDNEAATELCQMEYELTPGAKIQLMDKKDYKLKFGSSPDMSDSIVLLPEIARRRGFVLTAMQKTAEGEQETNETYQANQNVYSEEDEYQPENEGEPVENLV